MQDSRLVTIISMIILVTSLSACAPYPPDSPKAGICNQLNSQMIFSGSTGNTRQAEIQTAEQPMVARTYEKDNCDR